MKKVIWIPAMLVWVGVFAQKPGWQHLDLKKDSVFGISTEKAYRELLKGKKRQTVIVGVLDSGIDTLQEDLQKVLWTDPVSGAHGWDYIGAETGREDITKLVRDSAAFYDSLAYTTVPKAYRVAYRRHRWLLSELDGKIGGMENRVAELEAVEMSVKKIQRALRKEDLTVEDLKGCGDCGGEGFLAGLMTEHLIFYPDWKTYYDREIDGPLALARAHLLHGLRLANDEPDTATGDADVSPDEAGPLTSVYMFRDPITEHGTHVAGIIGAVRNNKTGMDGIADDVRILMIKDNGSLRELRDASLAKGIHYAVEHGAKVINLSFGKPYTWDKAAVDAAVRYAMEQDVLIVHAAGNAGENLDVEEHYPDPRYLDGGKAAAWLEVGASGPKDDPTLGAGFSNYGKRDVDVFAPGVGIYSTTPHNHYESWDGTSMAAPVVTGLAALIREYYPKLTAVQVKEIIMKSVVKRPVLTDKCVSGGVVNAYDALQLAGQYAKR